MNRLDPYTATCALAAAAVKNGVNERIMRFLAQLAGYPACSGCDFVVDHCRCEGSKRAYVPGVTWQGEGLS